MEKFEDYSKIYGRQIVVLPCSSEFEYNNLVQKIGEYKNVRFLSWSDTADPSLTFKALVKVQCLDLRGIKLTYLPPEIGLLEDLEVLDLRDNCLEYLPPELSQCLRLKSLLFEGNSIFYASQIQALNFLRQMNSAEGMAPQFKWSGQNGQFSIVSWNLVAQTESTQKRFHTTPQRFLLWSFRMEHILNIAQQLKPSIFCIQEIEQDCLEQLESRMKTIGYGVSASFGKRPPIPGNPIAGVATFYLKSRLTVERTITQCFSDLEPRENISKIQLIENDAVFQLSLVRLQGQSFYLLNTSLFPNRYEPDVTTAQLEILMANVQQFSGQAIICGSFGFTPKSKAYKMILNEDELAEERASIARQHQDEGKTYLMYHLPKGAGGNTFTQWEDDTMQTTDYIFLSNSLYSTGCLQTTTKDDAVFYHRYMPNNQWPSSHLPIGTTVEIRMSA